MKKLLKFILLYIIGNIIKAFVVLVSFGIFFIVFSLYSLPTEAVVYAAFLTLFFIMIVAAIDFIRSYKKHVTLLKLKKSITLSDFTFENTLNFIERDYQELIRALDEDRKNLACSKDAAYSDMIEYYTIWVHQIKTPISAMRLLLQSEPSEISSELGEQLFRIEQYVEMVLQYLRMQNMSNDLVIKRYSLDEIVKHAIRKYSKIFIRKKIRLDYEELGYQVLSDEKWLTFVIEQLLSNALKYTNKGCISIYMDKDMPDTLVIEDSGIGIDSSDLPRVFEKGYTGFNGRIDQKSTGIGLYLCRSILDKLSHTIKIETEAGKGTKVKIGLGTAKIAGE